MSDTEELENRLQEITEIMEDPDFQLVIRNNMDIISGFSSVKGIVNALFPDFGDFSIAINMIALGYLFGKRDAEINLDRDVWGDAFDE